MKSDTHLHARARYVPKYTRVDHSLLKRRARQSTNNPCTLVLIPAATMATRGHVGVITMLACVAVAGLTAVGATSTLYVQQSSDFVTRGTLPRVDRASRLSATDPAPGCPRLPLSLPGVGDVTRTTAWRVNVSVAMEAIDAALARFAVEFPGCGASAVVTFATSLVHQVYMYPSCIIASMHLTASPVHAWALANHRALGHNFPMHTLLTVTHNSAIYSKP